MKFNIGACSKSVDRHLGSLVPTSFSSNPNHIRKVQVLTSKRALTVHAAYRYWPSLHSDAYFLSTFIR